MKYVIKVNETKNHEGNIRGFASVTFEQSFKITNIVILESGRDGKVFVAMPSYKTKQTDENGKAIYQDLCYPVTREFREQLFGDILEAYEKECEKNRSEFSDRMKEQEKEKTGDAPVQEAAIR